MLKRHTLWVVLLLSVALLCGCTAKPLPFEQNNAPTVTLPPAQVSYVAPIGDAALTYTENAMLYLPAPDGISLSEVEAQVTYSPTRPKAESLMRTLLSQAATRQATALGGTVRLSLYGTSPVEVSRDVVTVNLSASALQLNREAFHLVCQAIANTLTQLGDIHYVNVLVVDKPVGLDITNTLPMGAYHASTEADLGAVYRQLLSRRSSGTESPNDTPFSADVTLYFPLLESNGMVSEVRTISFENQDLDELVVSVLRELGNGPMEKSIASPPLPLLSDLLSDKPALTSSENANGSILQLHFTHNLDDMLEAYGITREQCTAALCYTFSTFLPDVCGIRLTVGVSDATEGTEEEDVQLDFEVTHLRSDYADKLLDYAMLYFPNAETGKLQASKRPVAYHQSTNPRHLLYELSRGPQLQDSAPLLDSVIHHGSITDTTLLGFAMDHNTLLVNFSPAFETIGKELDAQQERLLVYAIVNTLCTDAHMKNVCFFLSGSQFEGFSGDIYWAGLFYPLPV